MFFATKQYVDLPLLKNSFYAVWSVEKRSLNIEASVVRNEVVIKGSECKYCVLT